MQKTGNPPENPAAGPNRTFQRTMQAMTNDGHTNAALVTGASSGIGRDLARLHAARGHNVVITARRDDRLRELADELTAAHGVEVLPIPADLADDDARAHLLDTITQRSIEIDVLINNAGFGVIGPLTDTAPERHRALIDVNITALTELTRAILPGMIERRRGHILNVASVAGFVPGPFQSTYYASKAYVVSFNEALVEELRGTGVTATCLCPGVTATEFASAAGASSDHAYGPSAATSMGVAEAGYAAMLAGRSLVVPGWKNRAIVALTRILPRATIRSLSARRTRRRVHRN